MENDFRINHTLEEIADEGGFLKEEMDLLLPNWTVKLQDVIAAAKTTNTEENQNAQAPNPAIQ